MNISGVRQKLFFPVERGSFLYSVYFVTFTLSVYVSAKRMKVIYEITLHSNESNDGKYMKQSVQ